MRVLETNESSELWMVMRSGSKSRDEMVPNLAGLIRQTTVEQEVTVWVVYTIRHLYGESLWPKEFSGHGHDRLLQRESNLWVRDENGKYRGLPNKASNLLCRALRGLYKSSDGREPGKEQTAYLYQQQQQVAQQQAAQAQAAQAAAHGMHPQHHLQHSGAAPMTGVMPAPSGTQHGYMQPNPYMNMPYQKR
ncbi:1156_t:CDS:2 [Acaulospora colombiana]|uniref:1156_t:CDS:1 n=1 Tax=Acaulospora colombiana TaxID=27376 RepID=A0ACA9P127_9GLOM|nr:1156_t:CDS:2 [Acaulospora colombiana]